MNSEKKVLDLSVRAVPSKLQVIGGREIPFTRAILSIHNMGNKEVVGFIMHATIAQEGGSIQDVSEALTKSNPVDLIEPEKSIDWDVYDLLLAGHPGVASKVHLWGYKAILNWRFDVAVWAQYQTPESATMLQTPIYRWSIRWIAAQTDLDVVDLAIEAVNE